MCHGSIDAGYQQKQLFKSLLIYMKWFKFHIAAGGAVSGFGGDALIGCIPLFYCVLMTPYLYSTRKVLKVWKHLDTVNPN